MGIFDKNDPQVETPGVVDQDEKKAKLAARNDAKKRLRDFMASCNDEQVKADLLLVIGDGKRGSSGLRKNGANQAILNRIIEAGDTGVSEMDIFKEFHIGRPDMKNKIRAFIKNVAPDERVWIAFNEDTESYSVAGYGAQAPKGWAGWVPADQVDL